MTFGKTDCVGDNEGEKTPSEEGLRRPTANGKIDS